jgi:low affinity Fe/Cu permease
MSRKQQASTRDDQGERRPASRRINAVLEAMAHRVTVWVGGNWAFAIALAIVIAWGMLGPVFEYSDTWQLVINTGTTIVTFLMVFLIQRSQNKESKAVQLKLNEIVSALDAASNRLIDAEDLSEEELEVLQAYYRSLAVMARKDQRVADSHSVEEAQDRHHEKLAATRTRRTHHRR